MPVLGLPFIGGVALTTAWRVVVKEVGGRWSIFEGWLGWVWTFWFVAIPFGLTFIAFLMTFWLLPNRRLAFRFLWPGALVTTFLFEALKQLFAVYVHTIATFDAIYGRYLKKFNPELVSNARALTELSRRKRFNVDVLVTEFSNRMAQRAPVDKEFCSRGLRALEWTLDPKVTSLSQAPPPYDLGPEMNIHPCPAK